MTVTQMGYILAVAREKNFRRAAEACFVSQPTLSAQIQKFEENLGVLIFDRSKSPVKATKMGETLIEQIKVVMTEVEKISEIVEEDSGAVKGELRVGMIPTILPYLLPLFLNSLNRKYPQLVLNVSELTTENCLKALEEEEIDVAILATREDRKKYSQTPLYKEEIMLFVNRSHSYLKKNKLSLDDLKAEEIWLLEEGHCLRDEIIKICGLTREIKKRPRNLNFRVGNLESLRFLVEENFGYTLLPELATSKLADQEKKFVRRFQSPVPKRNIYLTQRKRFLRGRAVEALKGEILENLPAKTP